MLKTLKRIRAIEVLSAVTEGEYAVVYTYDEAMKIIKEVITGAIERTTDYTYNADDDIEKEIITENGKTITKLYTYDEVTKNITNVGVTVV